ncbi:MAG TPA: PA domain-containing protein [Thermoanaerobaculia bacterium]|nr:PA domain-containing protein [Thermoanaerobaculia bacterium]
MPSSSPVVPRTLLAALAAALLAAPPATAGGVPGEGASAGGAAVTGHAAEGRFEPAAPEAAAALAAELRRLLADGLAERLGLASGPVTVRRSEDGLLRARVPARILSLSAAGPAGGAPGGGPVVGRIGLDPDRQLGLHRESGRPLLFTPDPVQPGSTIGHWDPSAFPNLLMEPSINPGLPFLGLDVTPAVMLDLGWPTVGAPGGPPEVGFSIFDLDRPGTGFTDPRPFAGAPGNPAATLGAARVNLVEAVLGAWGAALASPVPVDVLVSWQPLPCQAGFGAVLAGAAPLFVVAAEDEGLLPFTHTWYHVALGEALTGLDLSGPPSQGGGDIVVVLNSALDDECLGAGTGYYYGLDGSPPGNRIDLAPVVLHELAHGLGFSSFVDETDGRELEGLPGIYDRFLFDEDLNRAWPDLTDQERLFSAINFRDVTWTGPAANAAAAGFLGFGTPELEIASPPEIAGSYEIGAALFGPPVPDGGLAGEIVCMVDAPELPADVASPATGLAERTTLNGCGPAENAARLEGRIALIDRGECSFVDKVRTAQAAGAIGAIIANRAGDSTIVLGGAGADDVVIPAVSLGASDGNALRRAACPLAAAHLHGRVEVTVRWRRSTFQKPDGEEGNGKAVPISDNAAWFYFDRPDNPQLLVKIVNGCALPVARYWVLAGGVTNQEVWITITDTRTGASKTYRNPPGTPFDTILDTAAFATCP